MEEKIMHFSKDGINQLGQVKVWLIIALFLMQCPHDTCGVGQVTMAILPNDILLVIFSFYGEANWFDLLWWILLVHVCQRWWQVSFGSSLHLRLVLH
jgi:hypothetical protein